MNESREHAGLALIERHEDGTILEVEFLGVIAAVEEFAIDVGRAFGRHGAALLGEISLAHRFRHARGRLQRGEVHAGQPGVRAEQLHVEGVMLAAPRGRRSCPDPSGRDFPGDHAYSIARLTFGQKRRSQASSPEFFHSR